MRRFLKAICVFLSLAFAFTAVTFCWFSQDELVNLRDDFGSAKASYFKSGNGSKSNKYVIASATHFYNFAWLQYLGYFNHGKNGHNGRYQSYFEVDSSLTEIDLEILKSALPPIGTAEYPFIGNFEGNGVVIKNYTVSNEESALTKRPSAANFKDGVLALRGDGTQEVSTVGLFGITGDKDGVVSDVYGIYSETNKTGIFKDTATSQTAVPDAGVDKDEAYYSAMSVSNFYADELNVNSVSANTLVGLAAGYANAAIEKVGVYHCGITVNANATGLNGSDFVSKYSLLGDYNEETVSWGEKPGDENQQGGTIDLRKLSRRLNYIYTKVYSDRPTSGSNYSLSSDGKKFNGVNATVTFSGGIMSSYARQFKYDGIDESSVDNYYTDINFYMPLKVDEEVMGLNDDNTNVTSLIVDDKDIANGWNINEYYAKNDSEKVANDNTGYIVGGGKVRVRIQKLTSSASLQRSFGKATGSNILWGDNVQILTKRSAGDEEFKVISDTKNGCTDKSKIYSTLTDSSVGADGVVESSTFIRYDTIREDFDDLIGAKNYLYGLRFWYKGSEYGPQGSKASRITIEGKEYCTNAINFSVSSEHICTMLLGSYYQSNASQYVPEIYKVSRNEDGTISTVKRLNKVVKQTIDGKAVYKDSYEGDSLINGSTVYDRTWFQNIPGACLYYIEIPIEANTQYSNGEWKDFYAIGAYESSAYGAYMMYLDIGTNGSDDGSGNTPDKKYNITTLDFVNSTANPLSTAYADVVAKISKSSASQSGTSKIEFERAAGTSTNSDGEINTVLYYVLTNFNEKDVIFTPESLSKKVTSFDPFQE